MNHPVIKWTTTVEYYDQQTGEQLTKNNANTNYYVVKTDKKTEFNNNKTIGHVTIYKTCALKPQLKLDI